MRKEATSPVIVGECAWSQYSLDKSEICLQQESHGIYSPLPINESIRPFLITYCGHRTKKENVMKQRPLCLLLVILSTMLAPLTFAQAETPPPVDVTHITGNLHK